ncbi:hypothetical protein A2230_03685 [candidate division WOR-1 bacterium RIFOXYA2_FULL_36_21]|uniref:Uncharacterized protein n=1 Tax=candidate division WOR-1 bacterium RIFOXYB2_FULL_36_35 TaxID=1802578 RepID=A0A1F4S210_UNCSA|nr:MAG: hypothetical protein A2230_03685 [candidate division WOR-1 bacterium RIFOXYA2_FULL_36_21]OGC14427.1 MAG: hypothetical protein A2290_08380 [candidate division WOR-1 bacterium RIFOXYB2_FULL_36_35]OGC19947.1 MAG: hypothetical protein A2282_01705 [candidate division WOR-1 bacterium RIFOXYA12_FULL_36_13]
MVNPIKNKLLQRAVMSMTGNKFSCTPGGRLFRVALRDALVPAVGNNLRLATHLASDRSLVTGDGKLDLDIFQAKVGPLSEGTIELLKARDLVGKKSSIPGLLNSLIDRFGAANPESNLVVCTGLNPGLIEDAKAERAKLDHVHLKGDEVRPEASGGGAESTSVAASGGGSGGYLTNAVMRDRVTNFKRLLSSSVREEEKEDVLNRYINGERLTDIYTARKVFERLLKSERLGSLAGDALRVLKGDPSPLATGDQQKLVSDELNVLKNGIMNRFVEFLEGGEDGLIYYLAYLVLSENGADYAKKVALPTNLRNALDVGCKAIKSQDAFEKSKNPKRADSKVPDLVGGSFVRFCLAEESTPSKVGISFDHLLNVFTDPGSSRVIRKSVTKILASMFAGREQEVLSYAKAALLSDDRRVIEDGLVLARALYPTLGDKEDKIELRKCIEDLYRRKANKQRDVETELDTSIEETLIFLEQTTLCRANRVWAKTNVLSRLGLNDRLEKIRCDLSKEKKVQLREPSADPLPDEDDRSTFEYLQKLKTGKIKLIKLCVEGGMDEYVCAEEIGENKIRFLGKKEEDGNRRIQDGIIQKDGSIIVKDQVVGDYVGQYKVDHVQFLATEYETDASGRERARLTLESVLKNGFLRAVTRSEDDGVVTVGSTDKDDIRKDQNEALALGSVAGLVQMSLIAEKKYHMFNGGKIVIFVSKGGKGTRMGVESTAEDIDKGFTAVLNSTQETCSFTCVVPIAIQLPNAGKDFAILAGCDQNLWFFFNIITAPIRVGEKYLRDANEGIIVFSSKVEIEGKPDTQYGSILDLGHLLVLMGCLYDMEEKPKEIEKLRRVVRRLVLEMAGYAVDISDEQLGKMAVGEVYKEAGKVILKDLSLDFDRFNLFITGKFVHKAGVHVPEWLKEALDTTDKMRDLKKIGKAEEAWTTLVFAAGRSATKKEWDEIGKELGITLKYAEAWKVLRDVADGFIHSYLNTFLYALKQVLLRDLGGELSRMSFTVLDDGRQIELMNLLSKNPWYDWAGVFIRAMFEGFREARNKKRAALLEEVKELEKTRTDLLALIDKMQDYPELQDKFKEEFGFNDFEVTEGYVRNLKVDKRDCVVIAGTPLERLIRARAWMKVREKDEFKHVDPRDWFDYMRVSLKAYRLHNVAVAVGSRFNDGGTIVDSHQEHFDLMHQNAAFRDAKRLQQQASLYPYNLVPGIELAGVSIKKEDTRAELDVKLVKKLLINITRLNLDQNNLLGLDSLGEDSLANKVLQEYFEDLSSDELRLKAVKMNLFGSIGRPEPLAGQRESTEDELRRKLELLIMTKGKAVVLDRGEEIKTKTIKIGAQKAQMIRVGAKKVEKAELGDDFYTALLAQGFIDGEGYTIPEKFDSYVVHFRRDFNLEGLNVGERDQADKKDKIFEILQKYHGVVIWDLEHSYVAGDLPSGSVVNPWVIVNKAKVAKPLYIPHYKLINGLDYEDPVILMPTVFQTLEDGSLPTHERIGRGAIGVIYKKKSTRDDTVARYVLGHMGNAEDAELEGLTLALEQDVADADVRFPDGRRVDAAQYISTKEKLKPEDVIFGAGQLWKSLGNLLENYYEGTPKQIWDR